MNAVNRYFPESIKSLIDDVNLDDLVLEVERNESDFYKVFKQSERQQLDALIAQDRKIKSA